MSFSLLAVMFCCAISTTIGVSIGRGGRRLLNSIRASIVRRALNADAFGKTCHNDSVAEKMAGESDLLDFSPREDDSQSTLFSGHVDAPVLVDQELILAANRQLVTDNQKLKSDLDAARNEILRQQQLMSDCLTESRTDSLTSISNRRAFDYELTRMVALNRRESSPFSIVLLDIDHFKRINDQYGHIVGDRVLKDFAQILMNTFRASDVVARFGGEEFVAILPNCPLEEACFAAERVRAIINASWVHVGDLKLQVTSSFGVSEIDERESESELLERADMALYAAKRNGRDCCYYHLDDECRKYDLESNFPRAVSTPSTKVSLDSSFVDQPAADYQILNPASRVAQPKNTKSVLVASDC